MTYAQNYALLLLLTGYMDAATVRLFFKETKAPTGGEHGK